jgi:GNAT superfamily N-acetyltransferase
MGRMDIRAVPYDHPDASMLIAEVQAEYVIRYGGHDGTRVSQEEFEPPLGLFLVGYVDDEPVVSGGWRAHADGSVEVKRMYVVPSARGQGLARQLLAELELSAKRAGHHRIILETGSRQPEAESLYRSSGYTEVPAFGYYADYPNSIHLGKSLG